MESEIGLLVGVLVLGTAFVSFIGAMTFLMWFLRNGEQGWRVTLLLGEEPTRAESVMPYGEDMWLATFSGTSHNPGEAFDAIGQLVEVTGGVLQSQEVFGLTR